MEYVPSTFQIIILAVFLFIGAAFIALTEIESEGRNPWAALFPTWRITGETKSNHWFIKGCKAFSRFIKRPLTGYHFFFFFFMPFFFHLAFFAVPQLWSMELWLYFASLYFAWFIVWDFLWFVLNPFYTVKRFRKEYLTWYTGRWLGPIPMDYINSLSISAILTALRYWATSDIRVIYHYLLVISCLGLFVCLSLYLAPKYHKGYRWIREQK